MSSNESSPEKQNGVVEFANEQPVKKGPAKKLTVEKIYQKKSQLEHILLRPDTYIGKYSVIYYFSCYISYAHNLRTNCIVQFYEVCY